MSESPKEILKKARQVDRRIMLIGVEWEKLNQDIQALKSFDYGKPIVQSSGGRSEVETAAVRIADRKAELSAELQKQLAIRADAIDIVHSLPPGPERDVLTQRYILCNSWDQVASNLHYVYRYCIQLHNAAMKKVSHNLT